MRLPEPRMEVLSLAVGRPVAVRARQREIELVEQPGDIAMAVRLQHLENLARLAPFEIVKPSSAPDTSWHWLGRFALAQLHTRAISRRVDIPKT